MRREREKGNRNKEGKRVIDGNRDWKRKKKRDKGNTQYTYLETI